MARYSSRRNLYGRRPALVWLVAAALLSTICLSAPRAAYATNLELVVDTQTGSLFLRNSGETAEVFDGYSFNSPAAFVVDNFTPIGGLADAAGDGSVDANAEWFAFATPTASNLAEASLIAGSGSLGPGQVVSFGQVYDPSQSTTLTAQITQGLTDGPSATPILTNLIGDFRDLDADFNGDLMIDRLDFDLFISTLGSSVDLRADGNNDGVVNLADYAVWRNSPDLETNNPAPALGTPTSLLAAIPEPTTGMMMLIAGAAWALRQRP